MFITVIWQEFIFSSFSTTLIFEFRFRLFSFLELNISFTFFGVDDITDPPPKKIPPPLLSIRVKKS